MNAHVRANAFLIAATLLLCSVAYPLAVYAAAWIAFPAKATGGIVHDTDGKPVGSLLIAQEFKGDEFFQPRPSAASYNASASSGSNLGANNPKLRDRVSRQLGSIVKYRNGQPVGPDVEKWFREQPEPLADWAKRYKTLAGAWVTADPFNTAFVEQWLKGHAEITAAWKKENPQAAKEPKPEDLAVEFFASFAAAHPMRIPLIVEKKAGDKVEKLVEQVAEGADVQGWFFDMWLQEHAEKAKDIEPVPADMVTASGSGLDPHITLRSARYQIDRVVTAWSVKTKREAASLRPEIALLLNERAASPLLGFGGEPLVNVLELNLALLERYRSSMAH